MGEKEDFCDGLDNGRKVDACKQEQGLVTEKLQAEIKRAYGEVLSFDNLEPVDIRRSVAVPYVRTKPDSSEITLGHITLGSISEGFPEYVRELKESPSSSSLGRIDDFELAVFLLVLKRHEPLRGVRDFFTHEFESWHQRFQGSSLRANFLRIIQGIREEQREDFYKDADLMEQLVVLTDYIHEYCLATPPFSLVPAERLGLSAEKSWFDIHDGKSIGYVHKVLAQQHGKEVS